MKYISAYALVVLSGKTTPTEDDVKKILQEVGCEINAQDLSRTFASLKGKALHELIEAGSKKLAQVSVGGGSGSSGPSTGGAAPKQEAKKEEKKPEAKKEEEAADVGLGGDLFGEEW